MPLDKKTVQQIAHLARLSVPDSEIPRYQSELSRILDLAEQMQTCSTAEVEPMTHPFDAILRMRADEVTEFDQHEKFQNLAPATENGLYLVPKVIDQA